MDKFDECAQMFKKKKPQSSFNKIEDDIHKQSEELSEMKALMTNTLRGTED